MRIPLVRFSGLLAMLILLLSQSIQAKEYQLQDLRRQLQQRDQVILDLLERVESLERDLGVHPAKSKMDETRASDEQTEKKVEGDKSKSVPGLVVADESMAERALERSLTQDGALLLASGILEIEPRLTYTRQEDAAPGFVMSGGGVLASEVEHNSDSLTASLLFRLGLPGDAQLEIGLPYYWRRNETATTVNFSPVQTSTQSGRGRGDVQIAVAKTLLRGESGLADVIGRLTWDTDSGRISDNGVALSGGFNEVRGALSFIKRQDPVVFVGGLSYEYAFEKESLQPGATMAANFGSYIALNPQTSLNFAISMAYQRETRLDGNPLAGSDRKIASLIIGGSTLIARGTLLNLSVAVGLSKDANDFSVTVSVPIRLDSRIF